jgi:hypothetical protein
VILVIVLIFVVLLIWLAPKIVRSIRRLLAQARALFGGTRIAT